MKKLPQGWTIEDVLEIPEIQEVITKARHSAHEVCGLWHEPGTTYMSGSAGAMKYWVFRNDKREEGSKQPTHRLCVSRQKPRQEESRVNTNQQRQPAHDLF
jgi:hypothetical protein